MTTAVAKHWTINDIEAAMRAQGSHWWDAGALRFFNSRIGYEVFQGPGGVYFVSSERCNHDSPRLFTVRQFDPETSDLVSKGGSEFQEYASRSDARARAKREAAGPDGHINASAGHASDIVTTAEKHTPATDGDEFARTMRKELPKLTDTNRAKLLTLCRRHERYQVMRCGDGSEHSERNCELAEIQTPKLRRMILAILEAAGGGAIFGGDPRGCTVKITVPSGKTDDMGQDGICVPGA